MVTKNKKMKRRQTGRNKKIKRKSRICCLGNVRFYMRERIHVENNVGDTNNNNNNNEKPKEKFGSSTRKTFDRFTTKDSYTWNITDNTESTAV